MDKRNREIKKTAHDAGIETHIGIATYKCRKDRIAAAVIDDALKDTIDTNLIFFTDAKCKVAYALDLTKKFMDLNKYSTSKKDIWLIDDQESAILGAQKAGYKAVHANTDDISALFQPLLAHIEKYAIKKKQDDLQLQIKTKQQNNFKLSARFFSRRDDVNVYAKRKGLDVTDEEMAASSFGQHRSAY